MASQEQEQQDQIVPPQHQNQQPGLESQMNPRPASAGLFYRPSGKMDNKVAVITGGDSGIGRAVAVMFAKEGADIVIGYLNEDTDAKETQRLIQETGRQCEICPGDIGDSATCQKLVETAMSRFNRIDVLVNNAAEQHPQENIEDISDEQLERTFRTNIFAMFYMVRAAMPFLQKDACIINSTSVTAYRGSSHLVDYASTKGAIVAFTRSLAQQLIKRGIRVNGVAPGPVWTPLIPSTFGADEVAEFGKQVPMGRPAQPDEIAPCYVFLASDDSSYMNGQVLHPNGGEIVNG